jgi:hypothetical protein
MVADIARVTYDPSRQYRSLIYQQGRVTLEADNNEAIALEAEALRLETIDIIGPLGTPDDGYKVAPVGTDGLAIGPGILYLGGWRLEHDKAVDILKQPDWLDQPAPTDSVKRGAQVVSLLLTEQSVGAVEDRALREVALGGPDSAARARLMQRFLRTPAGGETCVIAWDTMQKLLATDGVDVDAKTLQIDPKARLQAGFVPGPATNNPCAPAAAGGYLGNDNQMIRVTVPSYDANAKTGTLLWGRDNASLLYRASMASSATTLTLTTIPVDQEHAPQQDQMVEILRVAANLGDGNHIAAGEGFVVGVAQGYAPDTQQVMLKKPLPSEYQKAGELLFMRLWQAQVNFVDGETTPLDSVSGITVTITMAASVPTKIVARPFWRFAVRPSMPQNIYPRRYADKPQPPDGPRQWIADLAVAEAFGERGWKVLENCVIPFKPLTQQSGGCCGLVLGPDEVVARGGLQAVVDALSGAPAVLSLRAGIYELSAPVLLTSKHNGLTIEGCSDGAIIRVAAGADPTPFRAGLMVLNGLKEITLRRLGFVAPAVPLTAAGADTNVTVTTLCCLLVGIAQMLTIEYCAFTLDAPSASGFGGAVVVLGATSQVTLRENVIAAGAKAVGAELFGVLAFVSDTNGSTELDRWEITENRFENLAYAAVGYAELGMITCRDNVVAGCGTGFVFGEGNLGTTANFTREALTLSDTEQNKTMAKVANAALRPDLLAHIMNQGAPFIAAAPITPAPQISDTARGALSDALKASGTALFKTFTALRGAADPAPDKTAAPEAVAAKETNTGIDSVDFDKVHAAAVAAELYERKLTPALRFQDNEVTLSQATTASWGGLVAVLSPDEPGSVIVSGNRVVTPNATIPACSLLFPYGAAVTGNILVQLAPAPQGATPLSCLNVVAVSLPASGSAAIAVSANVVIGTAPAPVVPEFILPARTLVPAAGWDFLNTVA